MMELVQQKTEKHYDDQMKQNNIDYINGEKKRKQEIEIITQKEAISNEPNQELDDLISNIKLISESTGESTSKVMAKLLKSGLIKQKL